MNKFLLSFCLGTLFFLGTNAQTFTGTGGAIPDNATLTCFTQSVTGVGSINSNYGLAKVCINITHDYVSDLEISLKSPSGLTIPLSMSNGGSSANYTNTCFTATATTSITAGSAPFTGTFLPEGSLGSFNNGQNANGTWSLCITDLYASDAGNLVNWSITFNNTPAPPPPAIPTCSGNAAPGDACNSATTVCNFNGFCGNTSASYAVDTWSDLTNAFCGSIDNNSFVKFTATATTVQFNVWVTTNTNGDGIQLFFYDGGCGSGAVNTYGCENQLLPTATGAAPHLVVASGLTIGNVYYMMIDGWAGDVCNYVLNPVSGVAALGVSPGSAFICPGNSVNLVATGGNGNYSWAPTTGLSTASGSTVEASPAVTTTYTVTSTSNVAGCSTGNISSNITVTVNSGSACNLPVNISQFQASVVRNAAVKLNWKTEQELGVISYRILRSLSSGGGFTVIGTVPAIANSNSNNYVYNDLAVEAGKTYYYQLEIVENTGTKKFSQIRTARLTGSQINAIVSPNPAHGFIQLRLENYAGVAKVQIINNNGQLVQEQSITAFNNSPVGISLSKLPAATYTLVIQTNNEKLVKKIVKL